MLKPYDSSKGDTIVEVMFATAVFAFLAISCMAIMNRGISMTERSLEISQVRQSMNDQATLLRFVQQDALANASSPSAAIWTKLLASASVQTKASTFGLVNDRCPDAKQLTTSAKPFVLSMTTGTNATVAYQNAAAKLVNGSTTTSAYPKVIADTGGAFVGTNGLWVETVVPTGSANFVDFHIRACWDAPGSDTPTTLGTIVRLYR